MSNVTSVLAQAKALSEQEQQELLTQLEEYLVLGSQVAQVTKEVKEMRFSKGSGFVASTILSICYFTLFL